jgi:hypothetical protein
MKTCEICKKQTNAPLAPKLMMGPKGYRTYLACPGCEKKAQSPTRKAVANAAQPV